MPTCTWWTSAFPSRWAACSSSRAILIHGDQHGVVTIPHDIATGIPDAIAKVEAMEKRIITACQSPDFTVDRLKAVYKEIRPGTY